MQPAIIFSIGFMMHAFGRLIETVRQLRSTQTELADGRAAAVIPLAVIPLAGRTAHRQSRR